MRHRHLLRLALLLAAAPALCAQTFTILHNFGGVSGDPSYPSTPGIIAQGQDGSLFSTTGNAELSSCCENSGLPGKAFTITTAGSVTVLHTFPAVKRFTQGLILGTDGKYYGSTTYAGAYGFGRVFKMTKDGALTTLYSFHGGADGARPSGPPIESEAGAFYGVTNGDNGTDLGSVYKVTRYGDFTLLHTFSGSDGAGAVGPLVQGTDFFFYGMTTGGGASGNGTIFRISRNGDFKVLFSFDGTNGQYPQSGLIQANDGNFYGTTPFGGTCCGVVFKMTPDYNVSVIHTMNGEEDGYGPWAGLVQATDGNLYGANNGGGPDDAGVLFRVTPGGTFTVMRTLTWTRDSGLRPLSQMIQHTNGRLYGMTWGGGSAGGGTFYSLDMGLKPFVTYLPTYGRAGASVQILGQGFTAASIVSFNGVPGTVTQVSPTFLKAVVPAGATTGPITVTTPTGTLTSNKTFIVHP